MIQKYTYGTPFETDAIVTSIPASEGTPAYGTISTENGFSFTYDMDDNDVVYGLGESNRGINKRGYVYESNCSDQPNHTEDKISLYGAHNFIVISGKQTFGLFVDYPGKLKFDIGYTLSSQIKITCEDADLYLYVIEGETPYDIVKQFRKIIGRSYIPPKFAFGFGQSRWGYTTADDFRKAADGYRENNIPIDMVYMDIDYMEDYKDFTVNQENFPDFEAYVNEMKEKGIHLVPIIDAGVKVEAGYDVYEEGVEKNYFCKREDGSDFVSAVWPGWTHFPDVLNADARAWFGQKYERLISKGIDGFWNDMNEPSIFYSQEGLADFKETAKKYVEGDPEVPHYMVGGKLQALANNHEDYKRFYHNVNGEQVRHDKVHNLYGYNMTRAAGEAFERLEPEKRILMFSRSSYIGMHRYGGVWQGDNKSWWSHLLLNVKMMPSLNMCGFLYTGADIGGFGADTTEELLMRWLEFGIFTPLMRNHSAAGTRQQEVYQFEKTDGFRHVIRLRYRLIPYLYSEYIKAALRDEMMFRPLSFDYPEDSYASQVEDQLLLGNELMLAPVCEQNARGRYVYLPEEMKLVRFLQDGTMKTRICPAGHQYIDVPLTDVVFFLRPDCCIPLAKPAQCTQEIDFENVRLLSYVKGNMASYEYYHDDGYGKDYDNPDHISILFTTEEG